MYVHTHTHTHTHTRAHALGLVEEPTGEEKKETGQDLPWRPVATTPHSQHRGPLVGELDPAGYN